MSDDRFKQTVEKIASSPTKRRLLGLAPKEFTKEAKGWVQNLLGREGGQEVVKGITKDVGTAALTASGALLANQLYEHLVDSQDKLESQNREIGKLTANQQFKSQMVNHLKPRYNKIFNKVKSDEVLQDADAAMLRSSYETMQRFAPNLAADENAVRSFLRESAMYGSGPSYATLKNLAEAEKAVSESGGMTEALPDMKAT